MPGTDRPKPRERRRGRGRGLADPDGPHPAVFLDRDGVLNVNRDDYVLTWDDFEWTPDVFEQVRRLYDAGFKLVVITNQSPVGRGLLDVAELQGIHQRMRREFARHRLHIDAVYHCPHHPAKGCRCRKPEPGMILEAAEDLDLDLARSYLLGDRESDIRAAEQAGVRDAFLIERDQGIQEGVDRILEDWQALQGT